MEDDVLSRAGLDEVVDEELGQPATTPLRMGEQERDVRLCEKQHTCEPIVDGILPRRGLTRVAGVGQHEGESHHHPLVEGDHAKVRVRDGLGHIDTGPEVLPRQAIDGAHVVGANVAEFHRVGPRRTTADAS